jgi:glycosyltransferase involved in cell wall biosynthesis
MPLFTVIIPTHNRADLLRITLRSLAEQTFGDYEAYIVDDGSADSTPEVFREFAGRPGWNFVRFETNRRQAYARNYVIARSSSKYVTFLDADDLWLPGRLEAFARKAAEAPEAGFIFSNGYIMRDSRVTGVFSEPGRQVPSGRLPAYMAISDRWLPYVTTNVAVLREAAEKAGPFREDMSHLEDMEFYVKVLRDYPAAFIPEPLSVYRIHTLSGSPASLTLKWDDGIKDFLEALRTAAPPPEAERELRDHLYGQYYTVFLKNARTRRARECLLETSGRGPAFALKYAATFTPRPVLAAMKAAYAVLRRGAPSPRGAGERGVQEWVDRMEGRRAG